MLKWFRKTVPLVIALCVVAYVALIVGRTYWLKHADHARILAACREAIANRRSYRNDKDKWHPYFDDVVILPPMPAELPAAIRELRPSVVLIYTNYMIIDKSLPFQRMGLVAFPSGAKQFGTEQYIDGLWFWNGDDSTGTVSK